MVGGFGSPMLSALQKQCLPPGDPSQHKEVRLRTHTNQTPTPGSFLLRHSVESRIITVSSYCGWNSYYYPRRFL